MKPEFIRKILIAIISVAFPMISTAADNSSIISELSSSLTGATTPADSLKILYNIYDLSSRLQKKDLTRAIYATAINANDTSARLDILRQTSNLFIRNDSILATIQREVEKIPECDDQKETLVYIKLVRLKCLTRYSSIQERKEKIGELIKEYANPSDDIYQQFEIIGSLCILIGENTRGYLLARYFEKSRELVDRIPTKSYALRNQILSQIPIIYDNMGLSDKTVKASKDVLALLDKLKEIYLEKGRIYRNYDSFYYINYRRMLANYKSLSPEEIENCYDKILELVKKDPDIAMDYNANHLADAYYYNARGEYVKAIPILKELTDSTDDTFLRLRILRMLRDAATATGDKQTLLDATLACNAGLEEYISIEFAEKYRELEIIYEINDLRLENQKLQIDKQRHQIRSNHIMLAISIAAFLILSVLSIILFRMFRRYKRQSASLAESNHRLKAERSSLQQAQEELIKARDKAYIAERHKTDFINNISHDVTAPLDAITEYSQLIVDCSDSDKKKYLSRYADIVKLNAELLTSLVNDILDIGILENPNLTVKLRPASLNTICDIALSSISGKLDPKVKLIFQKENARDTIIVTDSKRVEQVLINLLSNAAKFTSEGTITLDYEIDRSSNRLTFSVTDTGIGIPQGKERIIFERFEKIDRHSHGSGLGLSICALIARLLNGEIYADPNRTKGARFIFSIPM